MAKDDVSIKTQMGQKIGLLTEAWLCLLKLDYRNTHSETTRVLN